MSRSSKATMRNPGRRRDRVVTKDLREEQRDQRESSVVQAAMQRRTQIHRHGDDQNVESIPTQPPTPDPHPTLLTLSLKPQTTQIQNPHNSARSPPPTPSSSAV
ncbi:hypothetical protein ACFX2J_035172 [Malus domestica]